MEESARGLLRLASGAAGVSDGGRIWPGCFGVVFSALPYRGPGRSRASQAWAFTCLYSGLLRPGLEGLEGTGLAGCWTFLDTAQVTLQAIQTRIDVAADFHAAEVHVTRVTLGRNVSPRRAWADACLP